MTAPSPPHDGRHPTGPVVAAGRTADLYRLPGGLVLRRYRDGGDVAAEAALMRYVAAFDVPVPRVVSAAGTDLVMAWVPGGTLVAAVESGAVSLAEAGRVLADLHARLHRVPVPAGPDGGCVVHRDLHPENVLWTLAGPVLIDWRNAGTGTAAFDEGVTAIILAEIASRPADPRAATATELLAAFLAAAADPTGALEAAAAYRAADAGHAAIRADGTPPMAAVCRLVRALAG